MPIATTEAEQKMNDKVAEICDIMFATLKRFYPKDTDAHLIVVVTAMMEDINNAG